MKYNYQKKSVKKIARGLHGKNLLKIDHNRMKLISYFRMLQINNPRKFYSNKEKLLLKREKNYTMLSKAAFNTKMRAICTCRQQPFSKAAPVRKGVGKL